MRRFLQDQKELITSTRVLTKVVQDIYPGISQQSAITRKINDLRENLDVVPPGGESFEGSSVFIVEFSDHSPAFAAKVASSVTEELSGNIQGDFSRQNQLLVFILSGATQKLQKEMMDKESKVRDFETKQAIGTA